MPISTDDTSRLPLGTGEHAFEGRFLLGSQLLELTVESSRQDRLLKRKVTRFDIVKTRMQCSPPGTYRGAFDVFTKIVRNEVRP